MSARTSASGRGAWAFSTVLLVSLVSGLLPAGATHTPPLPLLASGQPANAISTFDWTPANAQAGTHIIDYIAFNKFGQSTPCQVTIMVAECYLFLGDSPLNHPLGNGDTLLLMPFWHYPVTLQQIPLVRVPDFPEYSGLHVYAQVGMFNPLVFPNDPMQLTSGIDITIGGGVVPYGNGGSGMQIWLDGAPNLGTDLRFRFSIPGM